MTLVFTGDEYADGGEYIARALHRRKVKASFFFTGRFYRNPNFQEVISALKSGGHYLGAHSDAHLLYCDWGRRDSLLVNQSEFVSDLKANYEAMQAYGLEWNDAPLFMPPYEWYNDTIADWTREIGLQLVNFSPGTRTAADYTWPGLPNYRSSREIMRSIRSYERGASNGLNGFIMLIHIGTDPRRADKFYRRLPCLLRYLRGKGYRLERIDALLDY